MTDVFSSTRRGLWMLPRILAENDFLESIDDADDLWRIGVDYFCGTDRNWNTTVALNLFRRAAAKNHSDAMWMVHKVEANGGAFPVDVQTNKSGTFPRKRDGIVAWLAGDMDDPRALHLLGCYGERYPWDRDEEALKKAAEKGYALSMGELALSASDDDEHRPWFHRGLAAGSLVCQHMALCDAASIDTAKLVRHAKRGLTLSSRKLAFSTSSETDISVRSIFWLFQCCAEGIVPIRNCLHLAGKVESRIEKKKLPSRFEIVVGRCAFGQLIDMELFGISVRNSPMDRIAALKNAVSSYSSFMSQLQGRVVCWLLVGKAIGLYKDVNVLIAKTAWNVTLSEIFEE